MSLWKFLTQPRRISSEHLPNPLNLWWKIALYFTLTKGQFDCDFFTNFPKNVFVRKCHLLNCHIWHSNISLRILPKFSKSQKFWMFFAGIGSSPKTIKKTNESLSLKLTHFWDPGSSRIISWYCAQIILSGASFPSNFDQFWLSL